MPDPLPPIRDERPVIIHEQSHTALWVVSLVSLGLNLLIIGGIIGACLAHHHREQEMKASPMAQGNPGFGGMHGFHDAGMGWGHHFGPGGFPGGADGHPGMMGMHGMGPMGMAGGMGRHEHGPADPAKMTDGIMAHLTQQLTLTSDEQAKIKPIIQAQVDQEQKDRETAKAAHEKAMADTKAKIRDLLTPDQQKLLDSMKGPGHGDAAPKPGE
jgi:hypothetical protein